jgi:hypothetical protein
VEHRLTEGYEEGLVEGLSRFVAIEQAGLRLADLPYSYFVQGYTTPADVIGVNPEHLWRELWRYPMGMVRAKFVEVVNAMRGATSADPLTDEQQGRLRAFADVIFSSARRLWTPDPSELARGWRVALR